MISKQKKNRGYRQFRTSTEVMLATIVTVFSVYGLWSLQPLSAIAPV